MKAERSYPVDYLKYEPKDKETPLEKTFRRNLLKNVVMRIVLSVRERKKQPKLSEVMDVWRKQKANSDDAADAKEKFQEKFIKLYSTEELIEEDDKDLKYK